LKDLKTHNFAIRPDGIEMPMFVPPQRRKGPLTVIIALAVMIFALVYLFVERRVRLPRTESPVQQLLQESWSDAAMAPR